MSENSDSKRAKERTAFSREVGAKAARKLKARRNATPGVWFGLGMMGLIGWSVAIPTLLGAALGLWLDERYPGGRSWTLALLVAGLAIATGGAIALLGIALAVLWGIGVSVVLAALSGIFQTALYRYARDGSAGGAFDTATLRGAFAPR